MSEAEADKLEEWRPFTDDERKRLRKLLQDDDRATWLRKQIRVFTPWVLTIVAGVAGAVEYLRTHWEP